jgi:hypothetical protein
MSYQHCYQSWAFTTLSSIRYLRFHSTTFLKIATRYRYFCSISVADCIISWLYLLKKDLEPDPEPHLETDLEQDTELDLEQDPELGSELDPNLDST